MSYQPNEAFNLLQSVQAQADQVDDGSGELPSADMLAYLARYTPRSKGKWDEKFNRLAVGRVFRITCGVMKLESMQVLASRQGKKHSKRFRVAATLPGPTDGSQGYCLEVMRVE